MKESPRTLAGGGGWGADKLEATMAMRTGRDWEKGQYPVFSGNEASGCVKQGGAGLRKVKVWQKHSGKGNGRPAKDWKQQ